jgi:mannan endo-1,4-beta-mannosidase
MMGSLNLMFFRFVFCGLIVGVFSNFVMGQGHLRVMGKHLLGPCGDTLILKGLNYAPYNWGWSVDQLRINELAKTKANCVRLVWYKNGSSGTPSNTYANFSLLDSALAQSVRNGLIPILELHDQTCQNSPASLISLANWFTQPAIIQLIQKYEHSLILNIANEVLYVNWTGNPTQAKVIFQNTYSTIVANLRASGIKIPIMIDGPDCGTNLDVLAERGPALVASDPEQNLIFSAHAYWYTYAGNDSTQMEAKIQNAENSSIYFVFGEVANLQDDVAMCQFVLNYKPLLTICKRRELGWLAWSWDNDGCPARQVSTTGSFSVLSPYGQDLVNNPQFGLATDTAAKSRYLNPEGCTTTSISDIQKGKIWNVYPNPCKGKIFLNSGIKSVRIELVSPLGKIKEIRSLKDENVENQEINIGNKPGIYWLRNDSGSIEKIVNLGF